MEPPILLESRRDQVEHAGPLREDHTLGHAAAARHHATTACRCRLAHRLTHRLTHRLAHRLACRLACHLLLEPHLLLLTTRVSRAFILICNPAELGEQRLDLGRRLPLVRVVHVDREAVGTRHGEELRAVARLPAEGAVSELRTAEAAEDALPAEAVAAGREYCVLRWLEAHRALEALFAAAALTSAAALAAAGLAAAARVAAALAAAALTTSTLATVFATARGGCIRVSRGRGASRSGGRGGASAGLLACLLRLAHSLEKGDRVRRDGATVGGELPRDRREGGGGVSSSLHEEGVVASLPQLQQQREDRRVLGERLALGDEGVELRLRTLRGVGDRSSERAQST